MSTTVERCTRSTTRAEYFVGAWANNWKWPKFIIGAVNAATPAAAVVFSMLRRFIVSSKIARVYTGWVVDVSHNGTARTPGFGRIPRNLPLGQVGCPVQSESLKEPVNPMK